MTHPTRSASLDSGNTCNTVTPPEDSAVPTPGPNLFGPQVVVPVELSALVATTNVPTSVRFVNMAANYADLSPSFVQSFGCLGSAITGGDDYASVPTGVHLRWKLPDGLTQGTVDGDSGVQYPRVPNRWLVVRSMTPPSDAKPDPNALPTPPKVSAFVVQSDALSPLTTNPFATNPFYQGTTASSFTSAWPSLCPEDQDESLAQAVGAQYIGAMTPLTGWTGETSTVPPFLTALGPGDPFFAAYYWNSFGVFGFYDSLSDLDSPGDTPPYTLSYMVVGWYSQSTGNPLDGLPDADAWVARMQALGWAWPGMSDPPAASSAPDPFPGDVLCQGVLYGVDWEGPQAPYQSGVPQVVSPQVAIGNTSIEALSALVASKLPDDVGLETLLDALQYGLMEALEGPDGLNALAEVMHDREFGTTNGGLTWDVRPIPAKQTPTSDPPPPPVPPAVPFPAAISQALAQLNRLQLQADLTGGQVQSLQRSLFATWYAHIQANLGPSGQGYPPDTTIKGFAQSVLMGSGAAPGLLAQALTSLSGLVGQIHDQIDTLTAALPSALPGYELISVPMPGFEQPNDPVVVIAGADGIERSFSYGGDGRFRSDGLLACRLFAPDQPPQTITSMTVSGPGLSAPQEVTAADLAAALPAFPAGGPLPNVVPALVAEMVFLDLALSGAIAQAALVKAGVAQPTAAQVAALAPSVQTQQTKLRAIYDTDRDPSTPGVPPVDPNAHLADYGFAGLAPSPLGLVDWAQPWIPIAFQWGADLSPSYDNTACADALTGWQLTVDASDADAPAASPLPTIDYTWAKAPVVAPTPMPVSGRIPINPNTTMQLSSQITTYVQGHPDDPYDAALTDAAKRIADLQIVSQALGGFNEALAMMSQTLQLSVVDPFDGAFGKKVYGLVEPKPPVDPWQPNGPVETSPQDIDAALASASDLAPDLAFSFNPVRAGWLKLTSLQLVDAFGQAQPIPFTTPVLSQALTPSSPSPDNAWAQLPPRLSQPARVRFQLLASSPADGQPTLATSDPATTPISGWVLPNLLDASLMFYDATGSLLGELQALDGNFGPSVGGARWNPAPGTDAPLGAPPTLPDPHLQALVDAILTLCRQAEPGQNPLLDFLDAIDESLWTVNPLGGWQDPTLPFLIGRPLAVVRATMALDLFGRPVYDQSLGGLTWLTQQSRPSTATFPTSVPTWDAAKGRYQYDPANSWLNLRLPVVLGDTARSLDGLVGYFVGDEQADPKAFQRFYTAFGQPSPPDGDRSGFVVSGLAPGDSPVQLSPDPAASPVTLTLLVDPRAPVHALSGALPSVSVSLDTAQTAPALAQMAVTFATGPLVMDSQRVALPVPRTADATGAWSFLTHPDPTHWVTTTDIGPVDASADLSPNPQQLVDGWLRLAAKPT